MTREEAINQLKQMCIGGTHEDDTPCDEYLRECYEAIDMAISALSVPERGKGVLEDIKAEINNLDFGFVDEEYKAGISYAVMKFNQMIDERMADVKGSNNCATWKYSREKRKMCCSMCGFDTLYLGKFCPNCGADMRPKPYGGDV